MNRLFLLFLLGIALNCSAQNDTLDFMHRQRLWVNPTQIITGQYTLAYGLRIYKNNWIELGGGYRYIPYSIVQKLPVAPQSFFELFANPQFGLGFTGPIGLISFTHYHHWKNFNGIQVELFYQHFSHPPDCYYNPSETFDHYTYSSIKDVYGVKFLFLTTITSTRHAIWQAYVGVGLHLAKGEITTYSYKSSYPCYECAHECVKDVNDPNVITAQSPFSYTLPILGHAGIRFGIQ